MNPVYWRKCASFCSFLICCSILVLLCLSLATDFWIVAEGKREGLGNITSHGHVHFGLFHGVKKLDSGLGERVFHFGVTDLRHSEPSLMNYSVWMATVGTLCASVLFTLVALIFSVINVATSPSEWITGTPGLILWNWCAVVFEISALSLWSVQFYSRLRHNVFVRDDVSSGWSSENRAVYGYSYWLMLAAVLLHVANIYILWSCSRTRRARKLHIPVDTDHAAAVNMIY